MKTVVSLLTGIRGEIIGNRVLIKCGEGVA